MKDFATFVQLVHSTSNLEMLEDLLVGITTQKEREEIVSRINIVEKLIEKIPQQQIAKELGVGVATVTRGSKELKNGRFKALKATYVD